MDPLSAIASVLSVLDVALRTTSALVKNADDARSASIERHVLAEEAACLLTILQRLQDRASGKALDLGWLNGRNDLVQQFRRAYDDLAAVLNWMSQQGSPNLRVDSRLLAQWRNGHSANLKSMLRLNK